MKRLNQLFLFCLLLATVASAAETIDSCAQKISSLIDPVKLSTLAKRGANPRVVKYVAILTDAKAEGLSPEKVARTAVALVGMKKETAKLTANAMLRNLAIAERLGCLNDEGLQEMRKGLAPTIRRGPYKGDELSVDHIIPRAVAPELDHVIANLELMPLRLNEGKQDRIGSRQKDLAKKLHKAGLLSEAGLQTVLQANKSPREPHSVQKTINRKPALNHYPNLLPRSRPDAQR